jgi:GDPmannose 4,6-dehydratase
MKKALIIGILSQDGRYMCQFLSKKGYTVYGTVRENDPRVAELRVSFPQIQIFHLNVENVFFLEKILKTISPDEIYNFSGLSSVAKSFENPVEYDLVNHRAVLEMLRVIEKFDVNKRIRFFQSGSSEMFGSTDLGEVHELSDMNPNSPYAESKFNAYLAVKSFRENYGLFAVNGILFNHESEYRNSDFLTKKLTNFLVTYKHKSKQQLTLGNIGASRDWSYVGDFIPGIWQSLQVELPSEYVLASGVQHTILQVLEIGCSLLNIDFNFDSDLRIDTKLHRPSESVPVRAITLKAKEELGWYSSYSLENLMSRLLKFETLRLCSGIEPPIFPEDFV